MTGRRADRFTCGRRARIAASLGERGRGSRLWVGSTEWPRLYGWTRPEQRPGVGDVEPKRGGACRDGGRAEEDRKSTRLNSSHLVISYAVFCLKKKKKTNETHRANRQGAVAAKQSS